MDWSQWPSGPFAGSHFLQVMCWTMPLVLLDDGRVPLVTRRPGNPEQLPLGLQQSRESCGKPYSLRLEAAYRVMVPGVSRPSRVYFRAKGYAPRYLSFRLCLKGRVLLTVVEMTILTVTPLQVVLSFRLLPSWFTCHASCRHWFPSSSTALH